MIGRVLRAACLALVVAVIGFQLWTARDEVAGAVDRIGVGRIAVSTLLALAGGVIGMLGWRRVLSGIGTRLALPVAVRMYFVGGLGKYLPGGLWPALAHAQAARALREPPARLAAGFLGSAALSVLAGMLVGLLVVPHLILADPVWWVLLPALALAALPVAAPRVLGWAIGGAQRLLRRTAPVTLPDRRTLMTGTAVMMSGWLVTGAHAAVLAAGLGASSVPAVTAVVGGFALASVIGMAAVVLPAGFGAREVVLGVVLASFLPLPSVVTVVVLSRVLSTLADLAAAGVALVAVRLPDPTPQPVA